MKIKITFILLFFTLLFLAEFQSKAIGADGGSGGTETYVVKKKKETIRSIAKKLKIEPQALASLNNIASVDQPLEEGQSIKVPAVQNTKHNNKQVTNTQVQAAESDPDTLKANPNKPKTAAQKYSLEIQKNRLLLIDATLELNEALMEGVQVSLDSLNKDDKNSLDEKDIQSTQYKMQRSRDKAVIKPYLIHFQDSLGKEIAALKFEKRRIDAGMNNVELKEARADTIIIEPTPAPKVTAPVAENNPVAIEEKPVPVEGKPAPVDSKKVDTVPAPIAKIETRVIEPETPPIETMQGILIDTARIAETKPLAKQPVVVIPKINTIKEPVVVEPVHWKTARALEPIPENSFSRDIMDIIVPQNVLPPVVAGDTAAYVPQEAKTSAPGNPAVRPLELDTIDHLKAELFLAKGLKAMTDKNYNEAEQYLKKSIDLEHYYYDAWLALADVHVQMGLYSEGLNEYKICEKLSAKSTKLYGKMGQAASKLKMTDEAFKYYQKSLKIDSNYIPSIKGRADIFTEAGKYDTAIMEYNRILLINRGYHAAYKLRGIAEYKNKDYAAAIDDFTRYLIFGEKDAVSHYYRGMAKIAQNETEDGCTDLAVAMKLGSAPATKMFQKNCDNKR